MEDDEIDEDLSQYTLATANGTFKRSDFVEEGHNPDDGLIEDAKKSHHNSILPQEEKKDDNDPDDEAVQSDDSGEEYYCDE